MVSMTHYELPYIMNGVGYDLILYCIIEKNSIAITHTDECIIMSRCALEGVEYAPNNTFFLIYNAL